MSRRYILDGETPVPEPNLIKWAKWYESATRTLENTEIGDVTVSTVFLATDHNFAGVGAPILWETMIFGGANDQWQERYSTAEEARAGHARAVAMVQASAA